MGRLTMFVQPTMSTQPSKNVFRDLGFDREEAENLRIRSDLMIILTEYIERAKLNANRRASHRKLQQTAVSDSDFLKRNSAYRRVEKLCKVIFEILEQLFSGFWKS